METNTMVPSPVGAPSVRGTVDLTEELGCTLDVEGEIVHTTKGGPWVRWSTLELLGWTGTAPPEDVLAVHSVRVCEALLAAAEQGSSE